MRAPSNLDSKIKFKSEGQRLRVFQRAHIQGHVFIHDDNQLFIAPLQNISAGGLFIDQLVALKTGDQVRVVVKSEKLQAPVQATGTIVRVERADAPEDRHGLAIEFTSISSRSREVIQNCVFETRMERVLKVA